MLNIEELREQFYIEYGEYITDKHSEETIAKAIMYYLSGKKENIKYVLQLGD